MLWPWRLRLHRRRSSALTQRAPAVELQLPPLTLAPHRITEFLAKLKQGITVTKHGRRGKPKSKILTLDREERSLSYYPTRKDQCAVQLRDIRAIVLGHTTKVFQRHATPDQEQFAMSFILQDGRTLDLELDSVLTLKLFSECMVFVVLNNSDVAQESVQLQGEFQKLRLIQLWCQMGKEQDRSIAFGEVPALLRRLGLDLNPSILEEQLRKHDRDRSGDMKFEEFREFVLELTDRPELKAIFQQYDAGQGHLHPGELRRFMVEMQKNVRWTEEDSRQLFRTLNGSDTAAEQLSMERFIWWLGDHEENNCISAARLAKQTQDMTHPLHDYYIATSHHTCLVGNQLDSPASVDLVREVLLGGCRCLDMDCCDGPDGDPVVTRAYTRCGTVPFRDVVACVRQWAFIENSCPVILCLAVHTSLPQQAKMADILQMELSSHLLIPPAGSMLPGRTWFSGGCSPQALANKVLVKCRLPPGCYRPGESTKDERDLNGMPEEVLSAASLAQHPELHADLAQLVSLKAVASPIGSRRRTGKGPVPEVVSFTAEEVAALPSGNVRGLAERALIFVYPAGRWMQSENPDPQGAWLEGCQLTALNWQTHDSFLRVYRTLFLRNGRCGYVLKPPLDDAVPPTQEPISLVLHVLAGQQLVYCPAGRRGSDALDPFVQVRVSGHPKDAVPGRVFGQPPETRVVPSNALNPQFNGTFRLRIHCPALAVLSLLVLHHDPPHSPIIAEAHLPVDLLAQGYRRVPLSDPKDSLPIPCSSLFCRFEFQRIAKPAAATVRQRAPG
eukprot:GGOE01001193.1.p1 GENE.GGOE01001193.1~~GGOE01001193.1.p1  ORF type:complete len:785 (-),score=208.88 GGOE01001193.1:52-2406(-)